MGLVVQNLLNVTATQLFEDQDLLGLALPCGRAGTPHSNGIQTLSNLMSGTPGSRTRIDVAGPDLAAVTLGARSTCQRHAFWKDRSTNKLDEILFKIV